MRNTNGIALDQIKEINISILNSDNICQHCAGWAGLNSFGRCLLGGNPLFSKNCPKFKLDTEFLEDEENNIHILPADSYEHIASKHCLCNPVKQIKDSRKIYMHKIVVLEEGFPHRI
jgi:hypothetical protein